MKSVLLEKIRVELGERLERLSRAATEAHAAATDPGSKAEGKYDTRSLEASYLASGQAKQVEELAEAVRIFQQWHPPEFAMEDEVQSGALVEVESEEGAERFLLAPCAGGLVVRDDCGDVTLLTPGSPLYGKLLGAKIGDSWERPAMTLTEVG